MSYEDDMRIKGSTHAHTHTHTPMREENREGQITARILMSKRALSLLYVYLVKLRLDETARGEKERDRANHSPRV
jgi:hypothetical protein